jgi:hypothetical protein
MKRDKELIRKLVLAVEDARNGYAPNGIDVEGYTQEQIRYHAYLLLDGGFIEGDRIDNTDSDSPEAIVRNLTWKGHEFADAARDETRWKKAVGIVQEKGGSVTISVLTQLLIELMKRGLLALP